MHTRIMKLFLLATTFLALITFVPSGTIRAAPRTIPEPLNPAHYIVSLKADQDAHGVAHATGVTPHHVYRHVLNGFVAQLTAGQRTALQHHPAVTWVEPDQIVEATATQPIDSTSGRWGLDRLDQRTLPLDGQYSFTTAGAGVTAYLIDSGLQADHPDFGTRAQNVYDAFGGTGNDCHGHGTHLAGIIGGTTSGVAKEVSLRGVRVLDCQAFGTISNVIAGIDWVVANAQHPAVATLAVSPKDFTSGNSPALQLAVENLITSGVFVAVSAGNGNVDACTVAPANISTAFTVAATIRTDNRASFSNHGSCVDLYAPGSGITSAWIGSTTNTLSGTSQATAFVAGVAALHQSTYGLGSQSTISAWLTANATLHAVGNNPPGTPNRLLAWVGTPRMVDAGGRHTCGLRADGSLICWGRNDYGQATPPSGIFTQLSMGYYHACALRPDRTVACWGNNGSGRATPPSGTFLQVNADGNHTCGLRTDRTVACWGENTLGAATPPSGTFTHVSAGYWHTCGVRTDATVACWGENTYGQATPPSGTFTHISAGGYHTCGLRSDMTLVCWGSNSQGEVTPPATWISPPSDG